ncbi:DUF2946 domain-containing protein [Acetobacter nitrogenifigens]|uniref:DUF2946 domain-containing protein n=1 Tax=Acetobacter nitrogenifigens TaxID=285268 RepID=UPI001FEF0249|nr:DUF2946 domain-containing protein [Acetobacter nitrogenifigens]
MPAVPCCASLPNRRLPRALKTLVVLVTLLGLFGQLALQSLAHLDEMPRTTLERLTGFQIGPKAVHHDMHMTMPGMSMAMDRHHTAPDHQHSHHDDGACFLCPLLHLPGIVLTTSLIVMVVAVRVVCTRYILPPAQAPPYGHGIRLPPPTGPPMTA